MTTSLDPIKATILQAATERQAHDPHGWEIATSQFAPCQPSIEEELAIDQEEYPDTFPEKVQQFLEQAIHEMVDAHTYYDSQTECRCWNGWLEPLDVEKAIDKTWKVRERLYGDRSTHHTPIERWLEWCVESSPGGSSRLRLGNPFFVVFLVFLVNYYDTHFIEEEPVR